MSLSKIKDKSFKVMCILFIVLFIADMTTTMMNPHYKILEVNALYQWKDSMWPVFALNFMVVGLTYWLYVRRKSSVSTRYHVMTILVITNATRIFAIINSIKWLMADVTAEVAQELATPQVMAQTQINLAYFIYLPLILCILTFILWKYDHIVRRKE